MKLLRIPYLLILLLTLWGCAGSTSSPPSEIIEIEEVKQQPEVEKLKYIFVLKEGQDHLENDEKVIVATNSETGQQSEITLREGYQYLQKSLYTIGMAAYYYNVAVERLVDIYDSDLGIDVEIPKKVEFRWYIPIPGYE